MEKFNYTRALREVGISYLGMRNSSAKLRLSGKNGTITYGIYLAPADMSGYNVCPVSKYCRQFCLNGSGNNKVELLAGKNRIQSSRIKKTRLFFENRELFMQILIHEINKEREYAWKHKMDFSVRLNCTSDISPEDFQIYGMNILEIFQDVQFYDYTKVPSRISLLKKYWNYDLTFSYNGHNAKSAQKFLERGGKVAVVFENQKELPKYFMGFPVCDGNLYDMRYRDPRSHIVGLHYHRTAANYDKEGNYIHPNSDFVVADENPLAVW